MKLRKLKEKTYKSNFKKSHTMKKGIYVLLVSAIVCLTARSAMAENFWIKDYNVDLFVNKNKQVTVTETISVFFKSSSHGLIRDIPYKNASITGVRVEGDDYQVSKNNHQVSVKIGNAAMLISGDKTYKIKYHYNYHDNKNEFYHNIIGTEWKVPIDHAQFKITLPENINPKEAGLSIGRYGMRGFSGGAEYTINGNVITGETSRILNPGEGITFRTPVSEGYFNRYHNWASYITLLFIVFLTVTAFIIWYKYGKDEMVIPIVSFKLPEGCHNVLDAEMYYRNGITQTGLTASLIDLANKGYIKIENSEEDFVLHKLKEYEEPTCAEEELFNSIFNSKNIVTKKDLETSSLFYRTCQNILSSTPPMKDMFEKDSVDVSRTQFMYRSVIAILFCLLIFASGFNILSLFNFKSITGFAIAFMGLFMFVTNWNEQKQLWSILYIFTVFALIGLGAEKYITSEYIYQILFSLVCAIITTICAANLPKDNKLTRQIKGQLEGLKRYINIAEKHKIEAISTYDPKQIFNVLPYAYILGVTGILLDKFQWISTVSPDLCPNYNPVYLPQFDGLISDTMRPSFANGGKQYSSSDGSSFSSSSGGGGFSGGGGGGGGGSSW